jgi:hypothetical protein
MAIDKAVLKLPLEARAEIALREAFRGVCEENLRLGLPVHVWRDGKAVALSPEEIREYLTKPEPPLSGRHSGVNGAPESGKKPE